ncbi:hypothetical protein BpHYR1_019580 [Brachionus plicatilis]|uniref:Uncharacterized protein n=1 Tax=Brachionus plicatilis TaxID=10195 RepID=A0A3M7RHX9_BRAPC|nr:hypothetical protein BpHYR1_019580 [Brachionus plicatilis]
MKKSYFIYVFKFLHYFFNSLKKNLKLYVDLFYYFVLTFTKPIILKYFLKLFPKSLKVTRVVIQSIKIAVLNKEPSKTLTDINFTKEAQFSKILDIFKKPNSLEFSIFIFSKRKKNLHN